MTPTFLKESATRGVPCGTDRWAEAQHEKMDIDTMPFIHICVCVPVRFSRAVGVRHVKGVMFRFYLVDKVLLVRKVVEITREDVVAQRSVVKSTVCLSVVLETYGLRHLSSHYRAQLGLP